ncbi:MAG: NAD-dependent epimerase/dehydratase family protein, partial [Phycisphaerae bacterium]
LEKFVHSYGLGMGYDICALRPTGIYGIAQPVQQSKWFPLVQKIVRGESVEVSGGGKEVHAADVAQSVELLLTAPGIAGQAYNCYDRYFSELDVATTANALSGSGATILGEATHPANQIETAKLRALGCSFGGWTLFEQTIGELVDAARARL